jgi:hypothetical protein
VRGLCIRASRRGAVLGSYRRSRPNAGEYLVPDPLRHPERMGLLPRNSARFAVEPAFRLRS